MKRHFHTFDALRFFACLKVFLFHLPFVSFPLFSYLTAGGGIGVIFFFVLSGFLITYIILEEKSETGKLNLFNFFVRRILRIWPLYFLMVGIAFSTPYILGILHIPYSNAGYTPNWLLSLTFLENYKIITTNSFPNVAPLPVMWSLCIEEHFYLLWGLVLYFVSIRKVPIVIMSSILLSILMNGIFIYHHLNTSEILTNLVYFAFGAIPAYLLIVQKARFENRMGNIPEFFKTSFIVILIAYIIWSPHLSFSGKAYFDPVIYGMLFCILICIVIPSNARLKIDQGNILSKLGIYTYGFYLYHTLVISILIKLFQKVNFSLASPFYALTFFVSSLAITLVISKLSYDYFENRFLRLKAYFYR